MHLTPEQKPLFFQRTVKAGEAPEKLYSNFTISVDKKAVDGEYYITISGKDKGLTFGSAVLSFKIGKGGKLPLPEKNVWNIGYTRDQPPPLSEEEKAEALAIVTDASHLKDKKYEITGVGLSFREFENFSGFFPVVTVNIRDKERPIAIMSYTIDIEDKKVIESSGIPLRPVPIEGVPIEDPGYFFGQSFSESFGILTKKWDAGNFPGFWRDAETGASTETLVINQNFLNSSYRVIEKHNLIYATKPAPLKYLVYAHANKTPPNTSYFYSAIGWFGEKYVLLQGNRLARIIFEQNAADVKTMHTGESWSLGEGYKIAANSIDVPLGGEEQAWIAFFKDNTILEDKVLPNNSLYSYPGTTNGSVQAYLLKDGREIWRTSLPWFRRVEAAKDDILFVNEHNGLNVTALRIEDGRIIWMHQSSLNFCSLSLSGSILYVGGSSDSAVLEALNATTGELIWRGVKVLGYNSASKPVISGDKLFLTAQDGKLYAFSHGTPGAGEYLGPPMRAPSLGAMLSILVLLAVFMIFMRKK